jgi:glycosyltransferase involved in cell wall biosynthesis
MTKILYIPHYPSYQLIKNRSYIIARELSRCTDVYFVQWHIPKNKDIFTRFTTQFKNLGMKLHTEDKLNLLNMPLLFKPENSTIKYAFNEYMVNSMIKGLGITAVINASMNLFRFPKIRNVLKIYDLVDDHLETNQNLNIDAQRLNNLIDDIRCADLTTAITEQVADKVRDRFHIEAVLVPNGVDMTQQQLQAIPKRNKTGRPVIFGFTGNIHQKWVNMELALDAFCAHLAQYPQDKFRIIGGGDTDYIRQLHEKYNRPQIEFIGPVSQNEIYRHFAELDIGVIPFHISSFTKNSLPIKAIEHGCFDSPVISTPVKALKKLSFVRFGDTVTDWQRLYKLLRNDNTHIDKNELAPYIWQDIVEKFYQDHFCRLPENTLQTAKV